jgi:tetratricopeptide (TPR) repeat protein/tRNA A-37 threonylcarbamoyl transferase component Bud32
MAAEGGPVPWFLPPCIAGYEVLQEAGRGGMSVVYKARQAHPERLVAIKMILSGVHAGVERQVRFLSEADAIARLQHPHIVQIYEVGQHESFPFLSLEFMNGGSLAQKLDGTPQPARQAASLVETLARAIHHAHEHGVIHRDLKPANILLTTDGIPKISDFGLAKQERPGLTATGAILGTPTYMAPEQAAGNNAAVGPPADIYALGVILYELLTGRPPFQSAAVQETLAQVRSQEPVPPRSLQPRLPCDLETICLKCLEKDPARRYLSALRLAADLSHFLKGETIEARPSPAWERFGKWMQRRPVTAAAVGVAAAATLGLVAMWAMFTLQLQRERNAASNSAREAEDERAHAEANQGKALDAVDRFLARVGDRRLAEIPEMDEVRRELLQEALGFCEEFLKQGGPNPDRNVRFQTGRTYGRMAKIQQSLSQFESAEQNYQGAISLLQQLANEFPDDSTYRYDLAKNYHNLCMLYREAKRGKEGDPFLLHALDLQESLVQEDPSSRDYRRDLATTYASLSTSRRGHGRTSEAEELLGKCMRIREDLCREQPEDRSAQAALTRARESMGYLLFDTHRVSESEKWFRQARDQWQALQHSRSNGMTYQDELANTVNSLGVVYENLGRMTDAVAAYRQCVATKKELAARHPSMPRYRFSLAWSYTNLGSACVKLGQIAEADAAYREGRNILKQLARERPKTNQYLLQLAKNEHGLATLQQTRGLLEQAEAGFRSVAAILEPVVQQEPENQACTVDLALAYVLLGSVFTDKDDARGALTWFDRAFPLLNGVLKTAPRHTFALEFTHEAHEGRALALTALGRYEQARADWDEALPYRHEVHTARHHAVWQALCWATAGQLKPALSEAQDLDRQALGSGDLLLIYRLAQVYALTAAGASQEPGRLTAEEREQCASRALELLQFLSAQKYFERESKRKALNADQAFASLQTRASFVKFRKQMDSPTSADAKK